VTVATRSDLYGLHPPDGLPPRHAKGETSTSSICVSRNNPTGGTIRKSQLTQWVDYAREKRSIILFDAAYETFIRDERLPHSIFEIEGARDVAIEFRSFSKTAGFTGTRCAYTVVPQVVHGLTRGGRAAGAASPLAPPAYHQVQRCLLPVQRAAEAVYSPEGRAQCRELIDYYLRKTRR